MIYASIIVVIAIIVVVFSSLKFAETNDDGFKKGKVIAKVGGMKVYEGDIMTRLKILSRGNDVKIEDVPQNILKAMVLEAYVNHTMDKDAAKLGYNSDKEINKIVKEFKKNLIREKYLNDKVYSSITDKEIQNEYNRLVDSVKGKEERRIKHILVNDEDEANRIRVNILRGSNFESLARERSIDKSSAQNGGDLGYVLKSELVPEFGDTAFILKVGAISKPVKTQYGWHIIKIEDVRPAQFLPFDQVKDKIRQKLQQDAIQKYLLSSTKDISVKFKIDFKQLPAATVDLKNAKEIKPEDEKSIKDEDNVNKIEEDKTQELDENSSEDTLQ